MLLRAVALLILIALGGCASRGALVISNIDRPLLDLQKIASRAMPLGLRKTSPNGREYFSNYFLVEGRKFRAAEKMPRRSYAHVLVLGDRRPYTIEVFVRIEQSDQNQGGAYSETATDQRLAKIIRRKILGELNKRREELNIIDDFRVF